MVKSAYKVDLSALHALCEANYARLLRLFPDYESRNGRQFALRAARVHIDVLERSRYTTFFRLQSCRDPRRDCDVVGQANKDSASKQAALHSEWLAPLSLEARAYHDVGMLEVVAFQAAGRTEGRYAYPNPAMHQQDEKSQQNAFLAEWLGHCLHYGEADLSDQLGDGLSDELGALLNPALKPGTQHA